MLKKLADLTEEERRDLAIREARIRREARDYGLRLRKSWSRTPSHDDYGKYVLIEATIGEYLLEPPGGGEWWALEELERFPGWYDWRERVGARECGYCGGAGWVYP